jgi:hypothetical protein
MSLINEALKRTRDVSFRSSGSRPAVTEPQYRLGTAGGHRQIAGRSAFWMILLVAVSAGAGMFVLSLRLPEADSRIHNAAQNHSQPNAAQTPAVEPAPVISIPPSGQKATEDQLVDRVVEKLKADQVSAKTEPPSPAVPVAPAPPEPMKFVLQGITSGPGWREAMINGYAVREGDEVDGARVTAVESRVVKLQTGNREIQLRMP